MSIDKKKQKKPYSLEEEINKGYDRIIRTSTIMMWFCAIAGILLTVLLVFRIVAEIIK